MNGKVTLQTVTKDKKVHIHHKNKLSSKKKTTPQLDIFFGAWARFCIVILGIIIFVLEFFAGGFEGACRAGLKLMKSKEVV